MSRGPGRIQTALEAVFATADPDCVFLLEDLVLLAYPDANTIERKHAVAVSRAIMRMADRTGWQRYIEHKKRFGRGYGKAVIFNRGSEISQKRAQALKSSMRGPGGRARAAAQIQLTDTSYE